MFCEVTATFDHQNLVCSSLSQSQPRKFPQDISVIAFLKMVGTDGQPQNIMSPALKCRANDKINQVLRGCGSGVVHVQMSCPGKILNPKLLLMCWSACTAATTISVWMYVWITVRHFGQKRLLNALKCKFNKQRQTKDTMGHRGNKWKNTLVRKRYN